MFWIGSQLNPSKSKYHNSFYCCTESIIIHTLWDMRISKNWTTLIIKKDYSQRSPDPSLSKYCHTCVVQDSQKQWQLSMWDPMCLTLKILSTSSRHLRKSWSEMKYILTAVYSYKINTWLIINWLKLILKYFLSVQTRRLVVFVSVIITWPNGWVSSICTFA